MYRKVPARVRHNKLNVSKEFELGVTVSEDLVEVELTPATSLVVRKEDLAVALGAPVPNEKNDQTKELQ